MSVRLLALLVALASLPAAAATVTATPATLSRVLDRAAAGDAITLAAGTYDAVVLRNRHWSPLVTIDATAATLRSVQLNDVSGLTWHGGRFGGGDAERYGFAVSTGDHLVVDGATFSHYMRNGIGIGLVSEARLTNNVFTDMGSDGIDIALSRHILVDHNHCRDFHPLPGAHPDCVQLWSRPTQAPTADIVVSNNEAIGDMQGFTAFNHIRPDASGKMADDGGFDRITWENNVSRVSTYHGVTVYDCRHCIVRNNRAETLPNAQYPKVKAWIKVIRGTDLTMCGNVAASWPGDPGQGRCSPEDAARQAGS